MKLSKIMLVVYGGGVIGGFVLAVTGVVLKSHPLIKTGGIVMLTTAAVFTIPFLVAVSISLVKKLRSVLKRKG